MKRRLQIARALINNPRVLILDEPTTGLDPQARHHVWAKLHELKERGVTLLITTHYMDEAEQLCDRLAIMDQGRIIAEDSPWNLIQREIPPQVVEIRAGSAARKDILESWGAELPMYEILSDRLLLYADSSDTLLQKVQALNIELKTVLTRRASLEDVFLKLTGRELTE
jgi:lipooligosaccharide transport system ATP-binding protein